MKTHVESHKMDFGVTVLAGLLGGQLDDLSRTTCTRSSLRKRTIVVPACLRTLDDYVAVLTKGRALHGERRGGPSAGLYRFSRVDGQRTLDRGGLGDVVRTCSKVCSCCSSLSDMMAVVS